MPGARTIASANPILTNYAAGLLPDLSSPLADFIAPRVTVGSTVGHYKKFDDKNQFRPHLQLQPAGAGNHH
jgi:hypothetical protein